MSEADNAWEYRGIRGKEPAPKSVGSREGRKAIIAGGAWCVWGDLEPFTDGNLDVKQWDFIAVNDIIQYLPVTLSHAVSAHPEFLRHWLALRKGHSRPDRFELTDDFEIHTFDKWRFTGDSEFVLRGDSGLLAVHVALALGYDEITLCGIPQIGLHGLPTHFFDPPLRDDAEFTPWGLRNGREFGGWNKNVPLGRDLWERAVENPEIRKRVRSMSGWTREALGAPVIPRVIARGYE